MKGEVSQNITISKQGTYRMIVRYLNKNKNISELFIRVRSLAQDGDEQKATLVRFLISSIFIFFGLINQINSFKVFAAQYGTLI